MREVEEKTSNLQYNIKTEERLTDKFYSEIYSFLEGGYHDSVIKYSALFHKYVMKYRLTFERNVGCYFSNDITDIIFSKLY
jgi:hypothetical protein